MTTSSSIRSSRSSQSIKNDEQEITSLLAKKAMHLPGYNWCQDWFQYLFNNHIVFGICCHHRFHPLKQGERILMLIGSIAFGVAVTNLFYLYSAFKGIDMNEVFFTLHMNATSFNITNFELIQNGRPYLVTYGMVYLWTIGGIIHTIFDLVIWNLFICPCCLPGSMCSSTIVRNFSSYITISIIIMTVALATYLLVIRIIRDQQIRDVEGQQAGDQDVAKAMGDPTGFLVGYAVELSLVYLVYFPLIATLIFSGILGCGRLPFLGGRPRQVQKMRENRMQKIDYDMP